MKVLLIEEDRMIVEAVSLTLHMAWPDADIHAAKTGEAGIEFAISEAPDLIVLDLHLPDGNGFDVLKQLRLFSGVPIAILSATDDEAYVVRGLEYGADEYIVKPFRQMEFVARLKRVMRWHGIASELRPIAYGNLRLDPATGELQHGGKTVQLTATETDIMHRLMSNPGRVVTHASLLRTPDAEVSSAAHNTVKVHIRRLREKVEEDPSKPRLILTKAGVGYQMAEHNTAVHPNTSRLDPS